MTTPTLTDNVTGNVWAFIDRAAELRARHARDEFSHEMLSDCLERGMESPIEHLFWIAVRTLCVRYGEGFNEPPPTEADSIGYGVALFPQVAIGRYRVDFLVRYWMPLDAEPGKGIIVELDGHAFHDKDQRQRSYEKARDRHLVKAGYRVLHYTGSDVVADPFAPAHEVLALLDVTREPYDPKNPMGVE